MPDDLLFPVGEPRPAAPLLPGVPRVQAPVRNQVEFRQGDLDSTIDEDHQARVVWAFCEKVDLSVLYQDVRAFENSAGRSPIDPRILFALWLYATLRAVGSARQLAQLCEDHAAYRWICGGVSVNYHTLADFRSQSEKTMEHILIKSIALLRAEGLVSMDRVAHDGLRTRASAGTKSFHSKATLDEMLKEATGQVEALRAELHADPGASTRRQKAARQRAAEEKLQRIQQAQRQLPEIEAHKKNKNAVARASVVDPDARTMKMPNGGFNPALNIQLSADTQSQIIVGVGISQCGSDHALAPKALEQIEAQAGCAPKEFLCDGGFAKPEAIEEISKKTIVYTHLTEHRDKDGNVLQPKKPDTPAVKEVRERMKTPKAQTIYKERASTIECVNALARNRGLRQLPVRGLKRAKAVVFLFVLAHNLARADSLRREQEAARKGSSG